MGESIRYPYLASLLADKFRAAPGHIHPEATLAELNLDSLAVNRLFQILQDAWQIYIEAESPSSNLTLNEVIALADASNTPPTA